MSVPRPGDGFAGRGDDAYEALIRGHEGLSDAESAAMNARLVLILANELGDLDRLAVAIALARRTGLAARSGAPVDPDPP